MMMCCNIEEQSFQNEAAAAESTDTAKQSNADVIIASAQTYAKAEAVDDFLEITIGVSIR